MQAARTARRQGLAHIISFSDNSRYEPFIRVSKDNEPRADFLNVPVYPHNERRFGYEGYPFQPHEVKTEFWLLSAHKVLADVFPVHGRWGCSAEFRAVVEELEPGVHQFFQIEVERPNGKPIARLDGRTVERGQFFILNCMQVLDAVLLDQCVGVFGVDKGTANINVRRSDSSLCVSRLLIAGHHLWQGKKHSLSGGFFVSDALMARLAKAKLKGFATEPVREA